MSAGESLAARAMTLLQGRGLALGRPLSWVEETGSTNDDAKAAAREGAPHGATWVAEAQRAGRGRQGRTWSGAPGHSLLASVLLRLPGPSEHKPLVALATGLVLRDALAERAPTAGLRVKWPNDVVVPDPSGQLLKIAGILVETAGDALVVGFGVNVGPSALVDLEAPAASLSLLGPAAGEPGASPCRAALLVSILEGLESTLPRVAARGLGPLHGHLAAMDALQGRTVRSDQGEGVAQGIHPSGALEVRTAEGIVRWSAGEVHLLPSRRDGLPPRPGSA